MTREDIIAMAREAGFATGTRDLADGIGAIQTVWPVGVETCLPTLERFADLVAAAERKRFAWTQEHWTEYERNIAAAAKAEEREACALLSEEYVCGNKASIEQDFIAESIAADIRSRGETK